MIKQYRKKPVVIEAIQVSRPQDLQEVLEWCKDAVLEPNEALFIRTLEGKMHVSQHDYVIKGVKGEFYPCKPDIFEATYEAN